MLTPELKSKWVENLRSGEYTQGVGRYRSSTAKGNPCYCVLGVLFCSTMNSGNDNWWRKNQHQEWLWVGPSISELAGDEKSAIAIENLIEDNDDLQASFADLADVIEKNRLI